MRLARRLVGIVGMLGLAAPGEVWAQDANDLARAREAFKEGLADEQAGRFEKAAREFDQARTLAQKETPQVLYHLGLCHARLGRVVMARDELSAALAHAQAEGLDKVAGTARSELSQVQPRIATLTVQRPAHGAVTSMTLDRVEATAKVGVAIEVDPGPHDVHAELSDAPAADVHVMVGDGEKKDVALGGGGAAAASASAPGAASAPAPGSASAPAPGSAPASAPASASAPAPAPASNGSGTLGWVLVGGGAAALVGGTVFWVLRSNTVNTLNGECGPGGQYCPASAKSDVDSGKLDDALAVTLWAVGGAAAVAGAGVLLFGRHAAPAETGVHVAPFVTGRSAGIGLTGVTW